MAEKELEAFKRDFVRLQEICILQEQRIFEISKEKETLTDRIDFFEKKEVLRREGDLKLIQEIQHFEAEIIRKDEELFTLNCIKKQYEETREKLSKLEKESISRKFEEKNTETEITELKDKISHLNRIISDLEKAKKESILNKLNSPMKTSEMFEERESLLTRISELEKQLAAKRKESASLNLSPKNQSKNVSFAQSTIDALALELKSSEMKILELENDLKETKIQLMTSLAFKESIERKYEISMFEKTQLSNELNQIQKTMKFLIEEIKKTKKRTRLSTNSLDDLKIQNSYEDVEQRMNKSALHSIGTIQQSIIEELKVSVDSILDEVKTLKQYSQIEIPTFNEEKEREITKLKAAIDIYFQEKEILLRDISHLENEKYGLKNELEISAMKILDLNNIIEKQRNSGDYSNSKSGYTHFRRVVSEGKKEKTNWKETLFEQKNYLVSLHQENMILREKLKDIENQNAFFKLFQKPENPGNSERMKKIIEEINILDRKRFEVQSQIIRISEDLIPYNELVAKVHSLNDEIKTRKSLQKVSSTGKLATGFPIYPISKPAEKPLEQATLQAILNENKFLQEEVHFLKAKVQDQTNHFRNQAQTPFKLENSQFNPFESKQNSSKELEKINFMLTQELEMHSKLGKLKATEIDNLKMSLIALKKENDDLRKVSVAPTPIYASSSFQSLRNTEPSSIITSKTDLPHSYLSDFDQRSAYTIPYTMRQSNFLDDPYGYSRKSTHFK